MRLKNILANAREQDGVRKLLKPKCSRATLGFARDHRWLGKLRFDIGEDGGGIGNGKNTDTNCPAACARDRR